MTLSESASLTPEQLRVAVAERLGWTKGPVTPEQSALYGLPRNSLAWFPPGKSEWEELDSPDYPNDREACEEFEKVIDTWDMDTRSKWMDFLALTCAWPETKNAADLRFETQYLTARASATQRCRAFLAVTENRNE